jgi:hypothetical protein
MNSKEQILPIPGEISCWFLQDHGHIASKNSLATATVGLLWPLHSQTLAHQWDKSEECRLSTKAKDSTSDHGCKSLSIAALLPSS